MVVSPRAPSTVYKPDHFVGAYILDNDGTLVDQPALGQAAMAASIPVVIASDQSAISTTLATSGYSASAAFTPANSSHTAGDAVGAAANFASMGPSGGRIMITGVTMMIDSTSAYATAWRLHLYNVTPPSAIADDAAWDFADADQASYLGYVDIPSTATDLGTNQWVEANGINKPVKLSGTGLFGYLTLLSTTTLGAVAHTVTLHAVAL